MKNVTTIAFDADDTLWHNERHFRLTQDRFAELLGAYAQGDHLTERLVEAERRNVGHYGYGVKGFTLSMIETAIEVSNGAAPASVIAEILAAGRDLLSHPVECFAGADATLRALKQRFQLVLVTKGDLFDQERKLAASGLDRWFDAVEIVSEKTPRTYERIFARFGDGADRSVMVGNSLRSDILPPLEIGAWAVYIPFELTWELEHAEEPAGHPRYRRLGTLESLPALLDL